jgi:S-adenosylmethionine hydrolase
MATGAGGPLGRLSFLSDYGLDDVFVGVCKGVVARIAPEVEVMDVCHHVAPQDVVQGAILLASAVGYFPAAVHLAMVDPQGSDRGGGLAVEAGGSILVGPDNGLLSLAWEALGGAGRAFAVENRELWLAGPTTTFRGRDIFAPVAAHLAAGRPLADVGPEVPVDGLVRLNLRDGTVDDDHVHAEVRHVDHFGNLSLNVARSDLEAAGITLGDQVELRCNGRSLTVPFTSTSGDVPPGRLALCEDAFRAVTLSVNFGHAARELRLGRGDPVVVSRTVPAGKTQGLTGGSVLQPGSVLP